MVVTRVPLLIVITSGRLVWTGKSFGSGNAAGAALTVEKTAAAKRKNVAGRIFMETSG